MAFRQSRAKSVHELKSTQWDVVIIGGGITGAGILRESSRRGLKAVLIEQQDFAWGTSSRSTKMVHGGIRYLKQGNVALTRESVVERENLVQELPGLVDNRWFILPFYKGKRWQRLTVQLGLILYNLLSGKWRRNRCTVAEMTARVPGVERNELRGGFLINDAVTDDARLVLRVLIEADKQGAKAINYCKAESLIKQNNKTCGVIVTDRIAHQDYRVHAKLVINATGAWADRLRSQVNKKNKKHIRPLRGSHLVLSAKRLPMIDNVSLIHPEDGRPVIALAWEGRVLMGTTDLDHHDGLDSEAAISHEEIRYLLAALNRQFPKANLTREDVISTMAGIRPVIDTGKSDPSKESRDHVSWLEDGLLTVTGGKLTTFRVIALDALRKAQEVLGPLTDLHKKIKMFEHPTAADSLTFPDLLPATLQRLSGRYGTFARELIATANTEELQPIPEIHTVWAELRWAAQNEMVVHLDDLMLRRTRIGILLEQGGKEYLPEIRRICQPVLAWSNQKWEEEERRYLSIWSNYYGLPAGSDRSPQPHGNIAG